MNDTKFNWFYLVAMVFAIALSIYILNIIRTQIKECEARGGVMVKGDLQYFCIKSEVLK